tara:strand:- start:3004 stop:3684 length:681 start_codon:yes stop_codon:yes gene_type:complete
MTEAGTSRMIEKVNRVRNFYRAETVPENYSGIVHLTIFSLCGVSVVIVCMLFLQNLKFAELLTIPVIFIMGNLVEYSLHRFAMHKPLENLFIIYKKHTIAHHHLFTDETMEIDKTVDLKFVLLSPLTLTIVIGIFTIPMGVFLGYVISVNVGLLYVGTAVGYMLFYEWFHLTYHLPEESWVSQIPIIKRLKKYHAFHHRLSNMSEMNFNIFLPIFDILFRTRNKVS